MKILAGLLVLFICLGGARASEEQVLNISSRYSAAKKQLLETENNRRKILGDLYSIKKKMKSIEKERGMLINRKQSADANYKSVKNIINGLNGKLSQQRVAVKKRIKAIYKFGHRGLLKMTFGSGAAGKLDRNLKALRILTDRDYRMFQNFKNNLSALKKQKQSLERKRARLRNIERDIDHQSKQLNAQVYQRNKLLEDMSVTKTLELAKLKKIKLESKNLTTKAEVRSLAMLKELVEPSFFEVRGRLPWPVSGRVVRDYGPLKLADDKLEIKNKGLLISTSPDSKVVSVFPGKVEFVGKVPGFGKTIILDHGDRYRTIYSHVKNALVGKGEKVLANQAVAQPGPIGPNEFGVHFEVRFFSEARNPNHWLEN